MSLPSPSLDKLRPTHLARQALVYVRQSSLAQVRSHTASAARQYDLAQRARDLGWPTAQIVVIDQDQGQSGASAVGRDGFRRLVATVGLGQAGAVLSLEASRLARASSDWYRLLELCILTDTLVIDEDGIYEPGQYNDRLLLGFKGTMSEAELHWLRARLVGGQREKARQGRLRMKLATGLARDPADAIVLDPDEAVQQALRLVFAVFATSRSARAVVQHFAAHGLRIPTRRWGGAHDGALTWSPLHYGRALAILHNPTYAGAYVYGRSQPRVHLRPDGPPRAGRVRHAAVAAWPVLLRDAHPGYLDWEQFVRNQQALDDNRTFRPEERRGAAREGAALLQGLALCGRCGRRMRVRYRAGGAVPYYDCAAVHNLAAGPTCQSVRGDGVDAAVAAHFLAALRPAELAIALAALTAVEEQAREADRHWQLRLERARYEADLARRRYTAVEPENRLVARNLEREWEGKLAEVAQLEREYARRPGAAGAPVDAAERQHILDLAQDLPTLWRAATTTNAERKQLLRCLIKDVTLTMQEATIHIGLRWQTEACTTATVPRPAPAHVLYRTPVPTVQRIRELAAAHPDRAIAAQLNAEGRTSGWGHALTAGIVRRLRGAYGIAHGCSDSPRACPAGPRGDGRYSTRAAAATLNVTPATIANWCATGQLDGVRPSPRGPWWVLLTPESIAKLRAKVARHGRRARPDGPSAPVEPLY